MKKLVFLFFALFMCIDVIAQDFEVDGISYRITTDGNVAVIYKDGYEGDFVIPSKVSYESKEYSVYSIESNAFQYNKKITSISIPNSIMWIGRDAFRDCTNLTAVYISDLKAWCNIDFEGSVFGWTNPLSYAHHLFLNGEEIKNLIIPEGITKISAYSFCGMTNLISVSFPTTVTEVGSMAFYNCEKLKRVDIIDLNAWLNIEFTWNPDLGVSSNPLQIAEHIYLNGNEIIDLDIPNDITEIKAFSFYNCKGLKTISIPSSVTSIGRSSFAGCNNVITLSLSSSLQTIGYSAFLGLNIKEVELFEGVTSIGGYAFSNCKGLNSIILPNSITEIGESAFESCENLAFVKLPEKLININRELFRYCSNLKSIELPDNLRKIGVSAFDGCSSLTSFKLPKSIEEIYIDAFKNCNGLEDFYCLNENVPSTHYYSFDHSIIKNVTLHVPEKSIELYKSESPWNLFKSIVSLETSNLSSIKNETKNKSVLYKLNGMKIIGSPRLKGLYINNGRKILTK